MAENEDNELWTDGDGEAQEPMTIELSQDGVTDPVGDVPQDEPEDASDTSSGITNGIYGL